MTIEETLKTPDAEEKAHRSTVLYFDGTKGKVERRKTFQLGTKGVRERKVCEKSQPLRAEEKQKRKKKTKKRIGIRQEGTLPFIYI